MERAKRVVQRIKGPVVPINTCFDSHESVDYTAVRKYVNWLCEQEVPVLLLTYGSSEFYSMNDEDIWRLTAEVAEVNAGRSLFITSTGWWPPAQCSEFLKHADHVGADAVKVQIHTALGASGETILRYFDGIQDAAPIPLLLWVVKPPYPVDVVAKLATHPNIVGMKNDADPFYYYYDVLRATADEDFAVISGGQMRNIAFGHQLGSPAYLCTIAPFRPDISRRFYGLLASGSYGEAWEMVRRYEDPWLQTALKHGWLQSIKSALELHGLYPNNRVPSPGISHSPEQRQEIKRCFEEVFGPIEKVSL